MAPWSSGLGHHPFMVVTSSSNLVGVIWRRGRLVEWVVPVCEQVGDWFNQIPKLKSDLLLHYIIAG